MQRPLPKTRVRESWGGGGAMPSPTNPKLNNWLLYLNFHIFSFHQITTTTKKAENKQVINNTNIYIVPMIYYDRHKLTMITMIDTN